MSLILEALKKSEAERRLGRAPGLLDSAPTRHRHSRLRPLHGLIGLGLLLGVAALAYWSGQREVAPPAPSARPSAADSALQPPGGAADTAARSVASEPSRSEPLQPAPALASPAPAATARPVASVAAPLPPPPAAPEPEANQRESRAQSVQPLAAARPPPPAAAETKAADIAELAGAVGSATESEIADATVTHAPPAPPPQRLPTVSSLSADLRGQLPPLKISMHVYTDDPDSRVLIVDGRRLKQGDTINERLLLREIRRDGGVLEYDGRRLLLERP
jgi:general secretion pathway protein B